MPSLLLEDNPPIITVGGVTAHSLPAPDERIGLRWFVALVKSQMDRAFAEALITQRVSYFLPMKGCKIHHKRRVVDGMKVLLPGYVFFHGDNEARYIATDTHRTFGIIDPVDQPRLYKQLIGFNAGLHTMEFTRFADFVPGRRVSFKHQAMSEITGVICSTVEKRGSLEVQLETPMMRGASVFTTDASNIVLL